MKSKKDNYNLTATAPMKVPGFTIFQSPDDGLHYFHFGDEKGKALLYSEGYPAPSTRDRGLASVKKNGAIAKRYKELKKGDKPYFILKAGNHQEIARSRNFNTKEEMEKAMMYLQNNITKKQLSVSEKALKAGNKRSSSKQTSLSNPLKYSYTLDFYPGSEEQLIRGKITNILTKRKGNFSGLDGPSIMNFIKEDLPEEMKAAPAKKDTSTATKNTVLDLSTKIGRAQAQAILLPKENLNLKIINKKSGRAENNLTRVMNYEILLSMVEKVGRPVTNELGKLLFEAKISPIGKSEPFTSWKESTEVGPDGTLKLSGLPSSLLNPGIYRLDIRSETEDNKNVMQGSTVVNVN